MNPRAPESIGIDAGGVILPGLLGVPVYPVGIVLFAHGSGSSRHSPRNRFVAEALQASGIGTLLFDLLSPDEEMKRENVFDIGVLAARLEAARRWVAHHPGTQDLPLGYFGASTGAAAALVAAAEDPTVRAVVSRGGRPDLAGGALPRVHAPTLLVVGANDAIVLALNQAAHRTLRCEKELAIVPGASHLFEEPGALETVTDLAVEWFERHLRGTATEERPERATASGRTRPKS